MKASLSNLSVKQKLQLIAAVLAIPILTYASALGPERGHTGAPGDLGDCTSCHDSFERANVGPGNVSISGNPSIYEPGQSYTLAIAVQDPAARRWGFQLTAIDKNGTRAGTLLPLAGDTQIATTGTGTFDRQYIEHSPAGSFPGSRNGHTWQVRWTAPETDIGAVDFFAAGNAANNDGTNQLDFIYTTNAHSESPSTVITLSLLTDPAGAILAPSSSFEIKWSATNAGNVEGYEVRYSTDDGMTFPLRNLIFSTTDGEIGGTAWTVPALSVAQARIRVQASSKTGSLAQVQSGRFSISASTSQAPEIKAVTIQGKHLFLSGDRFQDGAIVELNGEDIKTVNLDDVSHELKCKKAAKRIPEGTTVTIVVRNPDGQRSPAFPFSR